MTAKTVHLGFAVGSGTPIAVPIAHMAVTGQTQASGKTTTLEALVARSGATALTFVTKRGEGSFRGGRRIAPYFRDRADWQFVTSIIDATLQEKNKFLRPWIMKICRTTKSLAEVQERVREALVTARGLNEGVYTQLDAYLDLIVPEIERAELADKLDLAPGINVMDVSSFGTPMQMLFVQSALDWVNEHCRSTIVVIPEAWEFIPEGKGSPVKNSAVTLVRKGAGIGNHIWVDSQDMAGVDKVILRGCTVWLVGVQREANEIKRNLANIPAGISRPTTADVAMLERGQFFACFARTVVKTYVQPAWMEPGEAQAIACGTVSVDSVSKPKEAQVDESEARALREENRLQRQVIADLKAQLDRADLDPKALEEAEQRGMSAALRQAGEYWNAAALDIRDKAQSLTALADHLAEVAREGRWSVPRGVAKPVQSAALETARAPAVPETPAPKLARTPAAASGSVDVAMLAPLVRSHPQALSAELWGLFLGLSAGTTKSGPWHKKVRALTEAGYVEKVTAGFRSTAAGIAASNDAPDNPQNAVQLWQIWRKEIRDLVGDQAIALLRVLAVHRKYRLTNEQLALLAGKSAGTAKSGPWFTLLKTLREWDLIEGDRAFAITEKGRVIIPEGSAPAATDTAELLRQARYARLDVSRRHYDALDRAMTKRELGEVLGMSDGTMKSGPWHGAIKEMVSSGLVAEKDGLLERTAEPLISREPKEVAA